MSHLDKIGECLCRDDPVVGRLLLLAHPDQAGQHPVHDHSLHLGLRQHLKHIFVFMNIEVNIMIIILTSRGRGR